MIQPQTKSETVNDEPPTSDYGLRNLISKVDAKEMYIDELKNTRLTCCCCNLWLVAHSMMILEILLRSSDILMNLLNQEAEPHLQNAGITLDLMIILIAVSGCVTCEAVKMIPPQTKSGTANEEPEVHTSDYGLRNLISKVDAKEMYIDELKNTPLRCCCCNLWLVAHTLMVLEILLRISNITTDLLNEEAAPHLQNAGVTVSLMIIICCFVGVYGIRKCEPECIGAFIASMIVGVSWFHMLVIGIFIIERKVISIFVAIVVFTWIWYVPLIMIMWRVYKVARKYKYEAGPYRVNDTSDESNLH